ncbi:MAG: putative transcriptional regulator [Candidatus Thermoplasmatota archaeon]|nr:putative transcriptional regulator [Candidatus Thermoplasmatota archaeon]MBU1940848.1 putative transcriptional regulator [Candidatus Thermoplasmatota archaeon]
MLREETSDSALKFKRPLAIRALRRSIVRKKIAEYLFDISPTYSYTSEIAYNIQTTSSNVIGALRGSRPRYKPEESLLQLGIVEERTCGNQIRLYGLTDFGRDMMVSFKDRK